MAATSNIWNQLKNTTASELIKALKKDGWTRDPTSKGAILGYIKYGNPTNRITIHYHPKKTYGPKLLKGLIKDIGWSDQDLRRLKLIR